MTYIRVTGNSKDKAILNSNCSVVLLTQVNEGGGGGIDIIYLHDLPLSRFCNTQRNFSIVNQNFLHLYKHRNSIITMNYES